MQDVGISVGAFCVLGAAGLAGGIVQTFLLLLELTFTGVQNLAPGEDPDAAPAVVLDEATAFSVTFDHPPHDVVDGVADEPEVPPCVIVMVVALVLAHGERIGADLRHLLLVQPDAGPLNLDHQVALVVACASDGREHQAQTAAAAVGPSYLLVGQPGDSSQSTLQGLGQTDLGYGAGVLLAENPQLLFQHAVELVDFRRVERDWGSNSRVRSRPRKSMRSTAWAIVATRYVSGIRWTRSSRRTF